MEHKEDILKRVEKIQRTDFITSRFGSDWKKWAKETLSVEEIIRIAHYNGRTVVLLEREIEKLTKH